MLNIAYEPKGSIVIKAAQSHTLYLGSETSHPDRFFVFSLVLPDKCQDSTLQQAMTASIHILSHSSLTYHPFIQHYSLSSWESVIKYNKYTL
jgi:hypothetical protein